MVFLSDKQYLYLAFFVIGIIFFYIMHNILLLRSENSCALEPFTAVKTLKNNRSDLEPIKTNWTGYFCMKGRLSD